MQQSTQGAELNSEATLNCNGKDFKCVNSTHYQACSLTERSGQEPQYMINGVVLPCTVGQSCNDENAVNCAVGRTAQPVDTKPAVQIPVEVTVVKEQPALAVEKPSETAPAKSLLAADLDKPMDKPAAIMDKPAEIMETPMAMPMALPMEPSKDIPKDVPMDASKDAPKAIPMEESKDEPKDIPKDAPMEVKPVEPMPAKKGIHPFN